MQFGTRISGDCFLCLSSGVMLSNEWLMHPKRFPFPVILTCCHMAVSALVGALAVKSGMISKQQLSWKMWAKFCLPVGALSASALFFGNIAFLYMTVSFMQMLKANLPVLVFVVGCLFATEVFKISSFANMIVIASGVALASYGEVGFSASGVLCMFSGMCCEAVRLTLVQTLLQRQDLHMSPLSTLYYIMPISLVCLLPLVCISEARALQDCAFLTFNSLPAFLAKHMCCCGSESVKLCNGRDNVSPHNEIGSSRERYRPCSHFLHYVWWHPDVSWGGWVQYCLAWDLYT